MALDPTNTPSPELAGMMVVIVGPSGAGKDTLINFIRARLADRNDIHFVQRMITRPAEAGGEDHQAVTDQAFEACEAQGDFAVHWNAHGLRYGIPADVLNHLQAGKVVVANGSRSALPKFAASFARLLVVNIVAQPDILARRLAARGRESRDVIDSRLRRSESLKVPVGCDCITIDNSHALETAGEELLAVLEGLAAGKLRPSLQGSAVSPLLS